MALSSSDFINLLSMSVTSADKRMAFLFWARYLTKHDEVVLLSTVEVRSEASRGSWAAFCIADDSCCRNKKSCLRLRTNENGLNKN